MNELQGNSIALLEVRRKEGRKGIPEVNKRGKLYCKIKKTFVIRQETDGMDWILLLFRPFTRDFNTFQEQGACPEK